MSLYALTAIPGIISIVPSLSDFKPLYLTLVLAQMIAGLSIIIGTVLLFCMAPMLPKTIIYIGCVIASIGFVIKGFAFQYPLPFSFHISYSPGALGEGSGIRIHLPLLILAGIISFVSSKEEKRGHNKPADSTPTASP